MEANTETASITEPPHRLVFGDDGCAGSDLAWLWVHSQSWPGWELVVLHADAPMPGMTVAAEEASAHPSEGPPERPSFAEAQFTGTKSLVARADPRVALCEPLGADLLVVGPASGGLGPWHLGSTTEWLLQGPPAPIVVARGGRSVRKVLVATDGSPHADAAIEALIRLPLSAQAKIDVLAVTDGDVDQSVSAGAVGRLRDKGLDATERHAKGRPHRAVLAAAADGYDLVVLGTRGRHGLERLRLGSTASAVVRHAPCSVLVAHAD